MFNLSVKTRKDLGKKVKKSRKKGIVPAILYGPKIKNIPLELDLKEFEKTYKMAGESSLITLNFTDEKKKFLVLIHDIQLDPLTEKPFHVDFYQPSLEQETEVTVPIIFEGESLAVKELGGTLVKKISEIRVKAKPQNLPHEIKVSVEQLKTIDDHIKISNLKAPPGVKILGEPEEIIAFVSPPEKIEEELEKPIEEKVEEVEKVEKKKKEEVEEGVEEKEAPVKAETAKEGKK